MAPRRVDASTNMRARTAARLMRCQPQTSDWRWNSGRSSRVNLNKYRLKQQLTRVNPSPRAQTSCKCRNAETHSRSKLRLHLARKLVPINIAVVVLVFSGPQLLGYCERSSVGRPPPAPQGFLSEEGLHLKRIEPAVTVGVYLLEDSTRWGLLLDIH
eukprot:scaffold54912_cov63-Phaeocystis_antarctica.AAC.1